MKHKIIIRLDEKQMEVEVEGTKWEEICEYVFGNIEVFPKEEGKL